MFTSVLNVIISGVPTLGLEGRLIIAHLMETPKKREFQRQVFDVNNGETSGLRLGIV